MTYRTPLLALAGLLGLLLVSIVTTLIGAGTPGHWVNLALAAAMAAIVFTIYMGLRHMDGLLRVFALSGFAWLAFMFFLTLLDFMSQ